MISLSLCPSLFLFPSRPTPQNSFAEALRICNSRPGRGIVQQEVVLVVNMSLDELKYMAILAGSLPVSLFMKQTGIMVRALAASVFGIVMVFVSCGAHTLHSILTLLVTWGIIRLSAQHCYTLTLLWTFSYLLFFRLQTWLMLPEPPAFANAVQLILTLKLVSLSSELNRGFSELLSRQTDRSPATQRRLMHSLRPGLKDMFYYSYCYLGIMTGPFYRYKTHQDWVHEADLRKIPSWKPMLERLRLGPLYGVAFLLVSRLCPLGYVRTEEFGDRSLAYRLFYTSLIFFVFRMRFYVAWTFAECACIAAGFGAYPTAAKSRPGNGPTQQYFPGAREFEEYDYETVRNIDPGNTDFCTSIKDGMKYWNMTVQWWLANYIYRNAPVRARILRIGWTMLVSAFWHGIHPGYYLSFLTIPVCLAAEGAMDVGIRQRLGTRAGSAYDWVHWFLKMRAYDYMCMGFVLLTYRDTLAFWRSVHYYIHGLALAFFLLGYALTLARGERPGTRSRQNLAHPKTGGGRAPSPPREHTAPVQLPPLSPSQLLHHRRTQRAPHAGEAETSQGVGQEGSEPSTPRTPPPSPIAGGQQEGSVP